MGEAGRVPVVGEALLAHISPASRVSQIQDNCREEPMKAFLLTAAMALGLAASATIAAPVQGMAPIHGVPVHGVPVHGVPVHGIPVHGIPSPGRHCWPTRWNNWCHRHPIGIIIGRHPIGRVVGHPIGVTTVPNHGFPNGIQPEQRVQH
jgi:hypothetical protein